MASSQTSIATALTNPIVDNIALKINSEDSVQGCMCLSLNYLQFISKRKAFKDLQILATAVYSVDVVTKSNQTKGPGVVVLKLKDFRIISIEVADAQMCQSLAESIKLLSLPTTLDSLPCFSYQLSAVPDQPLISSNLVSCMFRWGCPSSSWRVSKANFKYQLCPSYPSEVIVPDAVTEEILQKVSKYRYLNRFPILCYYHKKSSAPLLLSSQPMMGSTQKRCSEDSQLLNSTLPAGTKGFVVDTRSQAQTQQQTLKGGGGVEVLECYPRWKLVYADLDSYQQLQTSLSKVIEMCQNPAMSSSNNWLGRVESSGWMKNIQLLLGNARIVISCLSKGLPVLVHGDTGYDAELQLVSVVQVILDPHCRTVRGFAELIERQWLRCGHPFSLRHRHCAAAPARESGPVFLAFLDAVYQIMCQFPTSFEFNERFLHFLFVHSYSSEFSTFIYDCQRERCNSKRYKKTKSLWSNLFSEEILPSLLNPLYAMNKHQLHISVIPQDLVFWSNCYLRKNAFESSVRLPMIDKVSQLTTENASILQHIKDLYREIEELQAINKDNQSGTGRSESDGCEGDALSIAQPPGQTESNITCNPTTTEDKSEASNQQSGDNDLQERREHSDSDLFEGGYITVSQPVTKERLSGDFVLIDNITVCSDGK